MAEARTRARQHDSAGCERTPQRDIAELAEAQDRTMVGCRIEFSPQPGSTGVSFSGRGFVVRRSTMHRCRHVDPGELQTIADMSGFRLGADARPMQSAEKPITRAIACEHATRAVCPVGSRCEPHHKKLRIGIAESRDRPSPILLVGERGSLGDGDRFAPFDETWTCPTVDDLGRDVRQLVQDPPGR